MAQRYDPLILCDRVAEGHKWETARKLNRRPAPWGWRLEQQCTTCGSYRHRIFTRTGEPSTAWTYDQSDDYRRTRQTARAMSKNAIRLAMIDVLSRLV